MACFSKYKKREGHSPLFPSFPLQMHYAVFDFLRSALIPELGADVAAGPAGHIHLVLIVVFALGTLPNQLAVLIGDNLISPS